MVWPTISAKSRGFEESAKKKLASHFTVLGDVDEEEIEPSTEISLTRGGRESKTSIKYHNMEWKTIRGRGKRGRLSRGSSH